MCFLNSFEVVKEHVALRIRHMNMANVVEPDDSAHWVVVHQK